MVDGWRSADSYEEMLTVLYSEDIFMLSLVVGSAAHAIQIWRMHYYRHAVRVFAELFEGSIFTVSFRYRTYQDGGHQLLWLLRVREVPDLHIYEESPNALVERLLQFIPQSPYVFTDEDKALLMSALLRLNGGQLCLKTSVCSG